MTDQRSNETPAQAERAARFKQAAKNLNVIAEKMLIQSAPEFVGEDIARLFMTVSLSLMVTAAGKEATVEFLHELAERVDADVWNSMDVLPAH